MDMKLYLNSGLSDLLISSTSSMISHFCKEQVSNSDKGLEGP